MVSLLGGVLVCLSVNGFGELEMKNRMQIKKIKLKAIKKLLCQ